MKRILIFTLFIAFKSIIVSQDNWKLYPYSPDSNRIESNLIDTIKPQLNYNLKNGEIIVFRDVRIDSIQKELSEKPTIMGWTVQILVSQQKEELKNTRIKFLKHFRINSFLMNIKLLIHTYTLGGFMIKYLLITLKMS